MNCIYAEITKSGRLKCAYNNKEGKEGEEGKTSSPSFSKMCPFQKYCQKDYKWIHINQNKCKYFTLEP